MEGMDSTHLRGRITSSGRGPSIFSRAKGPSRLNSTILPSVLFRRVFVPEVASRMSHRKHGRRQREVDRDGYVIPTWIHGHHVLEPVAVDVENGRCLRVRFLDEVNQCKGSALAPLVGPAVAVIVLSIASIRGLGMDHGILVIAVTGGNRPPVTVHITVWIRSRIQVVGVPALRLHALCALGGYEPVV